MKINVITHKKNNFWLFLVFTGIVLIVSSCTKKKDWHIVVQPDTGFPEIILPLSAQKEFRITSIDNMKGSIGYAYDSMVYWLKGMPEINTEEEGQVYTWSDSLVGKVLLTIKPVDDDYKVNIQQEEDSENKILKWFINVQASDKEYFTGIFERVVDGRQQKSWAEGITTGLNLRGEKMDVKLKPTVSAYAPFYISSNNYGFFVQGTWPGIIDFCREIKDKVQISWEGPGLEFKIYTGNQPLDIVQKHALETGPSIVPPEWAFGPWRWRDDNTNTTEYYDGTPIHAPFNGELVEDIFMMEAYDIPCSAYWIDRPWGPGKRGFDDYEWDTARFPQPEEMLSWLNNKGMELMLWIGPFVMGEMADYAEENNYSLVSNTWKRSRQILMDFTHPEAVKWWGENGPGKLARMGVKGFKLDRADGEKLVDSMHLITHKGTTYRENYNDYPHQYVKATYEAVQPVLGDDFILFPRAQYTGSARYGGMWAGDTKGNPEGLRSAVIALQRCAVMGYPVWTSDIGGYGNYFDREVCLRWLGFGCFSPLMEVGPTRNRGLWNTTDIPSYDTMLIATWRTYAKTRLHLIPYLQKLAVDAHETGTPIARPLFLTYPDQEEAWNDWLTYTLGSDVLVSVVWEKGKSKHKLYLPKGETWIDAWDTDKAYAGGAYIEVEVPLYKIPIFIRKGSEIDLGDLNKLYNESFEIASNKPDLKAMEKNEGWTE